MHTAPLLQDKSSTVSLAARFTKSQCEDGLNYNTEVKRVKA